MPKVSKDTVTEVQDFGVAVDHSARLDDYAIDFVTIRETHDLGPVLANLAAGRCTCPHWGYVIKGKITMRYADHEEIVEAGEAFYFPPGHAPEDPELGLPQDPAADLMVQPWVACITCRISVISASHWSVGLNWTSSVPASASGA